MKPDSSNDWLFFINQSTVNGEPGVMPPFKWPGNNNNPPANWTNAHPPKIILKWKKIDNKFANIQGTIIFPKGFADNQHILNINNGINIRFFFGRRDNASLGGSIPAKNSVPDLPEAFVSTNLGTNRTIIQYGSTDLASNSVQSYIVSDTPRRQQDVVISGSNEWWKYAVQIYVKSLNDKNFINTTDYWTISWNSFYQIS